MTERDFILAPQTVAVSVGLEPVHNVLNSLLLLAQATTRSGLSEWIYATASQFTPEQQRHNELIYHGLFDALAPERSWDSFEVYLNNLVVTPAEVLRDRALTWCDKKPESPGRDKLLGDLSAYLAFVDEMHQKHEKEFNAALFTEVHRLLNTPDEMKALILSHLREMWDQYLAKEWERVRPMLQEAVAAFQEIDYTGVTALEAIRLIARRDMSGMWDEFLAEFKRVIFVPSAHIGPYVTALEHADIVWIIFGAHLPEGTRTKSPALSRSELLVELSALADDTRLRILELLTQQEELCAQDIITLLDLSQSSASRHLRQLTATGYLTERRREVAKCYSLNLERADRTLRSLKEFLRGR